MSTLLLRFAGPMQAWGADARFDVCRTNREPTKSGVTYEGLLTVTDAAKFREALTSGIGRGKAYGLGLLTVVRP